jgi:hypothetical protein
VISPAQCPLHALEWVWRGRGRRWSVQASPEEVVAFRDLPEAKALADRAIGIKETGALTK